MGGASLLPKFFLEKRLGLQMGGSAPANPLGFFNGTATTTTTPRFGKKKKKNIFPNLLWKNDEVCKWGGGMVHHSSAKGGLRRGGFSKGA